MRIQNRDKVFCKKCKYYKKGDVVSTAYSKPDTCKCKRAVKVTVRDTYLEEIVIEDNECQLINLGNDCKYFEKEGN